MMKKPELAVLTPMEQLGRMMGKLPPVLQDAVASHASIYADGMSDCYDILRGSKTVTRPEA